MASTNFSTGTVITSTWLNDVNVATYTTVPSNSSDIANLQMSVSTNSSNITALQGQMAAIQGNITNAQNTSNAAQPISAKDASGGYVGLTTFNHNFYDTTGAYKSVFTNSNTAPRTYTFPDKSGTIATLADMPPTPSMQLLQTGTIISGVSVVSINGFSSSYDSYVVDLVGLYGPYSSAINLQMIKPGSTVDTGSYYGMGPNEGTISTGAAAITIAGSIGTAPSNATSISLKIMNVNSTAAKVVIVSGASSGYAIGRAGVYYAANTALGIWLSLPGGGTFTSGGYRLYGLKNS